MRWIGAIAKSEKRNFARERRALAAAAVEDEDADVGTEDETGRAAIDMVGESAGESVWVCCSIEIEEGVGGRGTDVESGGNGTLWKNGDADAECDRLASGVMSPWVAARSALRLERRKAKDVAEADRIRAELAKEGVLLKDGKDPQTGERVTTWEVKR